MHTGPGLSRLVLSLFKGEQQQGHSFAHIRLGRSGLGAGGGWGREGVGGVWEQKERERRGERGGEGVWGVRGGRGVRVGRLMGRLGRYKAVSKMIARRRRAKKIWGPKWALNKPPPALRSLV